MLPIFISISVGNLRKSDRLRAVWTQPVHLEQQLKMYTGTINVQIRRFLYISPKILPKNAQNGAVLYICCRA